MYNYNYIIEGVPTGFAYAKMIANNYRLKVVTIGKLFFWELKKMQV